MPSQSGTPSPAEARISRRRAAVPAVDYPQQLPISGAREDILDALRDSQVVVVAGETGSGKTTQLPKMCLELGRGVRGLIGHTQPRRLAARTVAQRMADELDVELGSQIGYQVRFSEQVGEDTLVKVMTDGVLLAEVQRDPLLRTYDTIIIDEAHERSLTIDFLIGYLKQLLPRRPDLSLVITSATIDPQRFSRHFGGAPIVEVSGRTYPVEVRYRPVDATDDPEHGEQRDQTEAISAAVDELAREGPGDVLVFLSGEREIHDTAEALRAEDRPNTEVLPLYARLSTAEQQRVFQPHSARRIVLATNVAETSLTVPGIRYVIDPGTARISRYSTRTRVQRLPIEKISQASADQRKGRCGRVADGVCIRLYSEQDYAARPAFTDPEILRTNLASVMLQMTALGLGDVDDFGFLDPPDRRSVRDAVQLLRELGAVEPDDGTQPRLTPVGRSLARLPVDPRIGRMLVEGDRSGCLREVLVIAAALSIQDPRERPAGQEGRADELHGRFADERSDFLAYLNLWTYLRRQRRAQSSNAFRRRCKAEYLHHLRVREWQDVHGQLRSLVKELGMTVNSEPAEAEVIHRCLLSGLLSHVGVQQADTREYQGAHGTRFLIWPGSVLAAKRPTWVMAAELVETSRRWARTVARVDPQWVEQLAAHLVRRSYHEPRWDARRGAAVADEKVTLYGLPIVASRTVAYTRINPAESRELFIRHGLVEGDWQAHHPFLQRNRELLAELADLEERSRRRDLLADDDTLFAFYDERIPPEVVSARHFDTWWKSTRPDQPDLLTFTRELLLDEANGGVQAADYPDVWPYGDLRLRVRYRFDPGAPDDGVTVEVPLTVLGRVGSGGFDWQVRGFRDELVSALLRALPKQMRRSLVPLPDVTRAVLQRLRPASEPLVDAVAREVQRETGVVVPRQAWDLQRVPDHLRITFRIVDGDRVVAQGKDLTELKRQLAGETRAVVAAVADDLQRTGLRAWTIGTVLPAVQLQRHGHALQGYPALVDEGSSVALRVLASPAEQARAMWQGTRRLLLLQLPPPARAVHARLPEDDKLVLSRSPHGSISALLDDCATCAVDTLMREHGGPAWEAEGFAKLHAAVAGDLDDAVVDIVGVVVQVLAAVGDVEAVMDRLTSPALQPALDDARAQLDALVHPRFVTATGRRRLVDLPRYVQAIEWRLRKLGDNLQRDRDRQQRVAAVIEEHAALQRRVGPHSDEVREIGWMIEELRVSLFAQHLGTRERVSEQRVLRAIADADAAHPPAVRG